MQGQFKMKIRMLSLLIIDISIDYGLSLDKKLFARVDTLQLVIVIRAKSGCVWPEKIVKMFLTSISHWQREGLYYHIIGLRSLPSDNVLNLCPLSSREEWLVVTKRLGTEAIVSIFLFDTNLALTCEKVHSTLVF